MSSNRGEKGAQPPARRKAPKHRTRHSWQNSWVKIRRFYSLYTTGLNRQEIEHLLQRDALDAYSYLKSKSDIDDAVTREPSPRSFLFVVKEIFISFIMRLTPARRLLYGITMAGFLWGLVTTHKPLMLGCFILLNFLLALELVDKLTTRDELEIAREIQISLQPEDIPKISMLSIASFSRPARVVGGDFFDVVQLRNDLVISIIGDVSGKGISAALYAAYIQSMFQSLSASGQSPSALMGSLNELISRRLRDGNFITAVIALFDTNEKTVTIARAGHNWPLYYAAESGTITELRPRGMSIGVSEGDRFRELLEEQKISLKTGDLLLFYSDGVTEATNKKNDMFDVSGLKRVIEESAHGSSRDIIQSINSRLRDFVRSEELQDDATLLAVKVE